MRISVPDKIAQPTGTTYTIVTYDCAGNGTVKFTGDPSTYSYTYIVGGKTATGTVATITGLAPGTYTMTIKYVDNTSVSSLINEDFGFGDPEPYIGINTNIFTLRIRVMILLLSISNILEPHIKIL